MVHNSEKIDDMQTSGLPSQDITFLYRLREGSSPKSYGINVAKLARLPCHVLENAFRQSKTFADAASGDAISVTRTATISLLRQFFNRIKSVIQSNMTQIEMNRVVYELWTRLGHLAVKGLSK